VNRTPSDGALLAGGARLVRLALDAYTTHKRGTPRLARSDQSTKPEQIEGEGRTRGGVPTEVHDVVAADGAVVHHDVCGRENEDETKSNRTNSREKIIIKKAERARAMWRCARTPGPERDGVPLLDIEALGLLPGGSGRGWGHDDAALALVHRETRRT